MGKEIGGFIFLSRKIFNSRVLQGPPLHFKLWVWMLLKANWTDNKRTGLKRGQFFASIDDMREAMSWKVGYRKHKPTKGEIRWAYETFTNNTMISRMNSTRGQIITILNYDKYQSPENYEQHSNNTPNSTVTTHYTKERYNTINKKRDRGNKKRGRLLPKDFSITEKMGVWFRDQGFKNIEIKKATEEWLDYWRSEGKLKVDWIATWRNGMRKAEQWASTRSGKDTSWHI